MELFNQLKQLALVSKGIHILHLLQIFLMPVFLIFQLLLQQFYFFLIKVKDGILSYMQAIVELSLVVFIALYFSF